jgi:hypothetical protein
VNLQPLFCQSAFRCGLNGLVEVVIQAQANGVEFVFNGAAGNRDAIRRHAKQSFMTEIDILVFGFCRPILGQEIFKTAANSRAIALRAALPRRPFCVDLVRAPPGKCSPALMRSASRLSNYLNL